VTLSTSAARVLSEEDLMKIEKAHAGGMTSAQIIQVFQSRGLRFSEATFRKYVQLGLLPRSKRVGAKGKHRGSRGIYPCATVRRINSIKSLMAQSLTIEQIQTRLSAFKQRVDAVETGIEELLDSFEREVGKPHFDRARSRALTLEVQQARQVARDLVRRIINIENEVTLAAQSDSASGALAAEM
jgi:DNA-binding transcriptional MerR regulator